MVSLRNVQHYVIYNYLFRPCKWAIIRLFVEPVIWLYNRGFGGEGARSRLTSYLSIGCIIDLTQRGWHTLRLLSRFLQNFASARETPSNFELHYTESKKWWTEPGYELFAFVPESRVSCKMCITPNQRRCRQYTSNFEFKYKSLLAQRSVVFVRESKWPVQNIYCNTKPHYSQNIISLLSFFNRESK